MVSLSQIFNWFKTGAIPTEQQFKDTFSSFWHKSEKLPQAQILGLNDALNSKADKSALENVAAGLIYKPAVATVAALATTYPNAQKGWAAKVTADGYIYQYDGTGWNNTGLKAFPDDVATNLDDWNQGDW